MSHCTHRLCWIKAAVTLKEHYCQENFPKGTLQALHSQLVHLLVLAYPYLKLRTMNLWKHIWFSCCLAPFFPVAVPEEENPIYHHHCWSGEGWKMAIAQQSITEAQNTPPKPCKQGRGSPSSLTASAQPYSPHRGHSRLPAVLQLMAHHWPTSLRSPYKSEALIKSNYLSKDMNISNHG